MKKLFGLVLIFMVFALTGVAMATSITFDVAGAPASSVTLSNISTWGWTSISASLVPGLGGTTFALGDGQSLTLPFFDIAVGGLGGGSANIAATLAFTSPPGTSATGSGSGFWLTAGGVVSGGSLQWNTEPSTVTLAGGNSFTVTFQNILTGGLGNSTTVDATVTAHTDPAVPEPSTMLLLGSGLIGLFVYGRKKLV